MKKVVMDKFKHFIIYLISFGLNYLIFIMLMIFFNKDNIIAINIVNLIAWIVSMLFIFYVDKKYVPDLVDENNSKELFRFILIRVLSLVIEIMIIYIFIIILKNDYYLVKLLSLILLFIFNEFYVKNFKFK